MRAVLDSNVGLKLELLETDSVKATELLDGYASGNHELIAPDIYPIEVAHALARAERKGILNSGAGTHALQRQLRVLPVLYPSLALLPRAFELASKARIGVYDCLYVALAEQENCDLITADLRLVNAGIYPRIVELSALP